MASSISTRMIVYLVAGEYCFSENGEIAWQEGAFRSKASAEEAARDAADGQDGRRCIIDGEVYGANWGCSCGGPDHGDDRSADPSDWEVSFEVRTHQIRD
jgi:hypothetical protein